jgi:hypothetical protein
MARKGGELESQGQQEFSAGNYVASKMSEWPAHCLYQAKLPASVWRGANIGLAQASKHVEVGGFHSPAE